ncbi:mechanosensitive ion channel family protein [Thalassotalea mangrovi]|uniref:Small-conductance mechanosensitive channel n=1 Tax=Thalassotalea mangrovi TaxID=2572245 RepID=A0A4U1B625_9GAMM|nr:mechanosensitive ion channel family protein [Thalassotalea mangrovi]TKB45959.1 mechanosensitive ion channel family protein [Thalassotalea mangrovi]
MTLTLEKFWSLIDEKLSYWLEITVKNLPNIVIAILMLVVFLLLAKWISQWLTSLFQRIFESSQVAGLVAGMIRIFIAAVGVFFALDIMGLSKAVASLLAGAGIIGLAIGFAFKDMTENLIAGVVMGIRKPFRVGDVIQAGDTFGTVKQINLRNTLIKNLYGQLTYVPNKVVFVNELINFSTNHIRRVEVPVGISYADDIETARSVLIDAINDIKGVIKQDETDVFAHEFADSSINLLVWFWIKYPDELHFVQMRHKAIVVIHKTLEQNNILIPFPIRTLDFDSQGVTPLQSLQIKSADRGE